MNAERFYTERKYLLRFTINVLNYLSALRKLWRENLRMRDGMKILDIGCGTGALTKTLYQVSREKFAAQIQFRAFDLTQSLLDDFQKWIIENNRADIKAIKADARKIEDDLPADWNNFDVICSSGVLEYLTEQELIAALQKIRNRLNDKGRLIVMGSREHCINRILIQGLYRANIYGKENFAYILRRAGFRTIDYWQFPKPYSYLNFWGYIAVAEK